MSSCFHVTFTFLFVVHSNVWYIPASFRLRSKPISVVVVYDIFACFVDLSATNSQCTIYLVGLILCSQCYDSVYLYIIVTCEVICGNSVITWWFVFGKYLMLKIKREITAGYQEMHQIKFRCKKLHKVHFKRTVRH